MNVRRGEVTALVTFWIHHSTQLTEEAVACSHWLMTRLMAFFFRCSNRPCNSLFCGPSRVESVGLLRGEQAAHSQNALSD